MAFFRQNLADSIVLTRTGNNSVRQFLQFEFALSFSWVPFSASLLMDRDTSISLQRAIGGGADRQALVSPIWRFYIKGMDRLDPPDTSFRTI